MATVTGMTAERMLAIEAASVVDGDVVGDNLILTKHDGTQINAGSVRGPKGDAGPIGQDLSVLSAVQINDVGIINQIRAGRQLTAVDFTNMGLSAPIGLWNLSDLTDVSGNGRNLLVKGAVTFVPGINGVAATSAFFSIAGGQALYISDTGAADPFRIRMGSFGCWFRTARRGAIQMLMDKYGTANQQAYSLTIGGNNILSCNASPDGASNVPQINGVSDVCDDRWHFVVITMDATAFRMYLDGVMESNILGTYFFPGGSAFNIGCRGSDAANAGVYQHLGRIDEAFITGEVLTEEQIRNLYCAKIAHTLAAVPKRASVSVRRRRKGAALVAGDFPVQPVRLHNFSGGSLGDEGSGGVVLTNNGAAVAVAAADGTVANAFTFTGTQSLSSTDNGLPTALAARSYGCWFKSASTAVMTMIGWGGPGALGVADVRLGLSSGGIFSTSVGDSIVPSPAFQADGKWHFAVVVEDNAAIDGGKRKLYCDGRLVGSSTALNAVGNGGANRFRVGNSPDGATQPFIGQIDAAFVCAQALTTEQIFALYSKGTQALAPSPKNEGDHIEAFTATNLLCLFDTLSGSDQIDLAVA